MARSIEKRRKKYLEKMGGKKLGKLGFQRFAQLMKNLHDR
jgi:hypothetical protein